MSKPSKKYYDFSLLLIVIILCLFGILMIYSASSYTAQLTEGDPTYYAVRQAGFVAAGIALMVIVSLLDYHWILKLAIPGWIVSIILMIVTMVAGKMVNGKRRWLVIAGVSFQPTEIVKIALIIALAVAITELGKAIDTWKGTAVVAVITAPLAGLVALNNLSSGIIVFLIAFGMYFMASRYKKRFLIILGIVALLLLFFEPIATFLHNLGLLRDYQYSRIMVWKDPAAHPLDGGYQVLQGLYAIGSGGLTGKGLGQSIQKLGFVPEAQNDMIFSIICEELGLIGAVGVILAFTFLLIRLMIIANSAPDKQGYFLCTGIMLQLALQVVLNIAVVSNVIPNTGITLPFISAGGTSVIILLCEIGVALSVSRRISSTKDNTN